jgi:hypothetical protein
MRFDDLSLPADLRAALAEVLALVDDKDQPVEKFERTCMNRVMQVGRALMRRKLASLSPKGAFVDAGVDWRIAVHSRREVMTSFGMLTVERPLFRSERNGPTRCLMAERAGLVGGMWTAPAAKVASLAAAEMPLGQAATFFAEMGTMTPSRSSILRLVGTLSDLWEADPRSTRQA